MMVYHVYYQDNVDTLKYKDCYSDGPAEYSYICINMYDHEYLVD